MAHLAFLDESGFMLTPTVRRTWAPRAQTPILFHRYSHEKISAISAVTVSPVRERLGLYCHLHFTNISHVEVAAFLRLLLQHLRGNIILIWDGGSIHKGPALNQLLSRNPRLQVERFPVYCINDLAGNDFYRQSKAKWQTWKKPKAVEAAGEGLD